MSLVINFFPRKGLFAATGVRRTPSQEAASALAEETDETMRIEVTGQWGPCVDERRSSRQDAALAMAAKTAETMIINTTGQWVALAVAAEARDKVKIHRVLAHLSEEIK